MTTNDIIENTVFSANEFVQSKKIPKFALGMTLIGGMESVDFWGLLHTDLLEKNLVANMANLQVNMANFRVNYSNNYLLQESVSKLSSIDEQLKYLNKIIAKKINFEERENFARELIYNINKMDVGLNSKADKSFVFFEANNLLYLIKKNKLSTASFSQICDKEYFEKVISNLKAKVDDLSIAEKEDFEGFVSVYMYALSLLEEWNSKKYVKTVNIPDNFEFPKEPVRDSILDCEEEIKNELTNIFKELGLFSINLKKYISSPDELSSFFEKFFEVKKEYSIELLKYRCFTNLNKAYNDKDKLSDLTTKINCCITLIDKYLELHPDFENDFPKISERECDVVDYNEVNQFFEKLLEEENENLKNYYDDFSNKLNLRNETAVKEASKKKKKSFLSFFFG